MRICDILVKKNIKVFLSGQNKREVMEELTNLLLAEYPEDTRKATLKALFERERISSTGIGDGVAIPHAKIEFAKDLMMAIGISKNEIDYAAPDNLPVRIFILLLCPQTRVGLHIKLLALTARLFGSQELRASLLSCRSTNELFRALKKFEEKHRIDKD